jgi:hypothetical protein
MPVRSFFVQVSCWAMRCGSGGPNEVRTMGKVRRDGPWSRISVKGGPLARGHEDRRAGGPENMRTGGPVDTRTRGPEDMRSQGSHLGAWHPGDLLVAWPLVLGSSNLGPSNPWSSSRPVLVTTGPRVNGPSGQRALGSSCPPCLIWRATPGPSRRWRRRPGTCCPCGRRRR